MVLLATIGVMLAQEAELAGSWSGAFTPSLLHAVLFGSRFGFFWWMREVVVVAALGLTLFVSRRGSSSWHTAPQPAEVAGRVPATSPTSPAPLDWWHAVLEAMRRVPHLPTRLVRGARRCSW